MTVRAADRVACTVLALFVPTIYSDEGHGWTG
jgi:hypothetical protein